MISIVIPTLNEENYIGNLLHKLSQQIDKNFEVIVVDGTSKDSTKKVVSSFKKIMHLSLYNCKKKSPAIQRNIGAKKAKYDYLLFLDADVLLEDSFIEQLIKKIKSKKIDFATVKYIPLTHNKWDKFIYHIINLFFFSVQKISPSSMGLCLLVNKKLHQKVGGFNEKTWCASDLSYCKKIKKKANFYYLNNLKIFVSTRRFEKYGSRKVFYQWLKMFFYVQWKGDIIDNMFNYPFGKY